MMPAVTTAMMALLCLAGPLLPTSQAFMTNPVVRTSSFVRSRPGLADSPRHLQILVRRAVGEDLQNRENEESRRKRIMDLQREITEDILLVSEEEREARKAKSLQERAAARKAIYQAYANVGSQESLSINQIGIPKKMSKSSKAAYVDETDRAIDPGMPFAERKARLLFDSLWISSLGLALVWGLGSYQASVSYLLGASLGFGYVTLLGRYVESLGKGGPGSGLGSARFALVILLVLLAGKYRDTIQVIPSVAGFFMYQVASFLQAFDPPKPEEE